jgi:D-alanyl-D-alanine carboxypeptidase
MQIERPRSLVTRTRTLSLLLSSFLSILAAPGCIAIEEPDEDVEQAGSRTPTGLQDHLDTLHAAGITGVLGELHLGSRRFAARSGTARLEDTRPVPWNARFRMGSNTKTFVAVVVLQLAGEGRLSLDDTVEQWLPGVVSGHGNDGSQISIRQLLQHTSGLYNYTDDLLAGYTAEDYRARRFQHFEPAELVAMGLAHPPIFAPGTNWSYSNTNYILAGMIIQKVTGRDWRREVRTRIIEPLRLRDTFEPGDQADVSGPHAHSYERFAEGEPLVDVTLQNHTWADAAGSLITTTGDLGRFWQALQRGKLLPPAQLAEMQTTVLAGPFQDFWPGARYGLGIMQAPTSCGVPYWSHFGDTLGFATRNAITDDGDRFVAVSLTTQLGGEAGLATLLEGLQLLDDAICADR